MIKVTINLPDSTIDALRSLSCYRDITLNQALVQAVANEYFFTAMRTQGKKVLLRDPDGMYWEVVYETIARLDDGAKE